MTRTKTIEFINYSDFDNLLPPVPSSKMLPDWYKNIVSYLPFSKKEMIDKKGTKQSTIKKCMPVFDSLTAGYFIVTGADLEITQTDTTPLFVWSALDMIAFHPEEQLTNYPGVKEAAPKLRSDWGYKTPKGYSCLFVSPFHRDNEIVIMPAIVDTDTFHNPVNFPFLLKNPKFEGLIPRGTPVVQVIPFKRDSWNHEIVKKTPHDKKLWDYILDSVFRDGYKNSFWTRKQFK